MSENQQQSQKSTDQSEETEGVELPKTVNDLDLDELLADIDDTLEENAAEFVANYIQKGGQ